MSTSIFSRLQYIPFPTLGRLADKKDQLACSREDPHSNFHRNRIAIGASFLDEAHCTCKISPCFKLPALSQSLKVPVRIFHPDVDLPKSNSFRVDPDRIIVAIGLRNHLNFFLVKSLESHDLRWRVNDGCLTATVHFTGMMQNFGFLHQNSTLSAYSELVLTMLILPLECVANSIKKSQFRIFDTHNCLIASDRSAARGPQCDRAAGQRRYWVAAIGLQLA